MARILVIEDDASMLELMTYLLTAFGHHALTATDGESGVAVASAAIPDLVLCDIQLPKLDGYGVARWFRDSPLLNEIPLIAVTALAMVGDRERILGAGFDGYLSKPIVPETFVGEIETFLPRELRAGRNAARE